MSQSRFPRRGITLVELMVVLAILAVVMSVATLARPSTVATPTDSAAAVVALARTTALATGHAVTKTVQVDGRPRMVTAFSDGIVVADSTLDIDPLTGFRPDTLNDQWERHVR